MLYCKRKTCICT